MAGGSSSLGAVLQLLIAEPSPTAEHGLQGARASVVVAHGSRCLSSGRQMAHLEGKWELIQRRDLLVSHSVVSNSATQWTIALQASLSFTISQSLLKLMPIESVMPSNHLVLYRPFLLLPSFFPRIRVFSNESVLCIRWPENWSFSLSISPSNEYSRLISFRMDWLDLLAVQSRVFSNTTVQKHQFFSPQSSYKRVSEWIKLSH